MAVTATTWRQLEHNRFKNHPFKKPRTCPVSSSVWRLHVVFNSRGRQCACACPAATTHPAHAAKSHNARGTLHRRSHTIILPVYCWPLVLILTHALPRVGEWLVIHLFRRFINLPSVVFKTRDAGVGLGGNNNRAHCCPARITQPPGPCRVASPGEYSRPVLPIKSPRAAVMDEEAPRQQQQQQPDRGERSVAGLLTGLQGAEASALQLRIKNSIWWGRVQIPLMLYGNDWAAQQQQTPARL